MDYIANTLNLKKYKEHYMKTIQDAMRNQIEKVVTHSGIVFTKQSNTKENEQQNKTLNLTYKLTECEQENENQ